MTTQRTHAAVVTVATRAPLQILQVPTISPQDGEVLIRIQWTASTPLDLHQADGGLLVKHPQVLGDGIGGVVVEVGGKKNRLKVGDEVFGFTWREQKEKGHQEFVTAPEYILGKLPSGFSLVDAVTLPNNFVTVFHAVSHDLDLPLPWPKPNSYVPEHADAPILIWGGSSSVGQYALQILRYYGYRNLLATASKRHHQLLRSYGATQCFDYRDDDVIEQILNVVKGNSNTPAIPFVLDCIGSKDASIAPIAKVAQRRTKVAILLPVIVRDATEDVEPIYDLDVENIVPWAAGVEAVGVRTHFHLENELFKEHLQPTIMPTLLAEGIVRPNKARIVEGKTLLERAQKAMDILRRKEVSGERLVWRVSEE